MGKAILIVDDEKTILQSLKGALSDEGFEPILVENGIQAIRNIEEEIPDLVLLDIWMPDMDGIEVLIKIKEIHPHLQVIMMSGHGNIETAVKAAKLGAYDFIEKPIDLDKLQLSIKNALNYNQLEEEIYLLKEKKRDKYNITGRSKAILEIKEQIRIVAPTNAWVLITGENGTGKELVANSIHLMSKRSHKPMIEVNCAAIPEELIESILFGHEKGAFTGAASMQRGKFDQAHEGTIFLDEIGDMSLKAQSKTLRILQEQRFERVGGSRTIKVDVRVLAATNKDLEAEIEKNTFREDLYFRLNVIPIRVPSLKERLDDIPLLVDGFLDYFACQTNTDKKKITQESIRILQKYNWPGNIRELKNLVERLTIMIRDDVIHPDDIPPSFHQSSAFNKDFMSSAFKYDNFRKAKNAFEKAFIERKLREFNGNISQTSEAIGIERSNLHKKIKAYDLNVLKS